MTLLLLFLFCSLCSESVLWFFRSLFNVHFFQSSRLQTGNIHNSNVNDYRGRNWTLSAGLGNPNLFTESGTQKTKPCAVQSGTVKLLSSFIFPRNWCSQLFARFHAGTLRWSRSSTSRSPQIPDTGHATSCQHALVTQVSNYDSAILEAGRFQFQFFRFVNCSWH